MNTEDFERNEQSRELGKYIEGFQVAKSCLMDIQHELRGGTGYKVRATLEKLKSIMEPLKKA